MQVGFILGTTPRNHTLMVDLELFDFQYIVLAIGNVAQVSQGIKAKPIAELFSIVYRCKVATDAKL